MNVIQGKNHWVSQKLFGKQTQKSGPKIIKKNKSNSGSVYGT
jgi:hypothetical protein